MKNVIAFPASSTMTTEQALLHALDYARNDNLREVLITGYDADAQLVVLSSRMNRKDALWLAEQLRLYALNADD